MKTTITIDANGHTYRNHKQALCEFVAAHGLDPNDVPTPLTVELHDGAVTFQRIVRDETGRPLIGCIEAVTVEQVAPWPLDTLREIER